MMLRLQRALGLAFILALPLWLIDLGLAVWRHGFFEGWILAALTALGLIQLLVCCALLGALVLLPPASPWGHALESAWRVRKQPGQAGGAYALVALAVGMLVGLWLAFRVHTAFEGVFATAVYTAALRAAAIAGAVILGCVGGRRLGLLVKRFAGPKWLSPARLAMACFGGGLLAYGWLWWQRDLLFKEIDPWPIFALGLVALIALSLALFAHRFAPSSRWGIAGSLLFMVTLLIGPGQSTKVAYGLSGALPLASSLAQRLRPRADFDGDGVSSWLGGGDCAPFDPLSFPGAIDFPDDGIDQDCFAGDLSSKQKAMDLDPHFLPVEKGTEPELIVLVSVDALRPDFLGFYGHRTYPTSPKIDTWARGAVVFDNAYTSGPYTTIALPSMLTGFLMGQMPGYIRDLYDEQVASPIVKLPDAQVTIAERLKAAGYVTGAVVSGFDIRSNGYDQGFDQVELISKRSFDTADKVSAAARKWLAEHPTGKRFLWLHYFDPHDPYFHDVKPNFGKAPKARYAGSIAFMDNHLGPLLNDLAEQPNSLVGLVSDHGESLGEKGAYGHGYNLHGHEARIVMAWRGRGLRPRRIEGASSLVDVAPTLLNAAGQKTIQSAGLSLLGVLRGGAHDRFRPVLTESYRRGQHVSVSTADWRLFYHLEQSRFELYDKRLDPAEKSNRAEENPEQVQVMRELLLALMNRGGTFVRQGQRVRELIVDEIPPSALLPKPVRFGDAIELVGFAMGQGGDASRPLHVATLYLRALRRMDKSWKVAFGMKGPRPMNKDHLPGRNYYPTDQWPAGVIIKDPVILGDMSRFGRSKWTLTVGFYSDKSRLEPQADGGLPLTRSKTRVVVAKDIWIAPMPWAVERKRQRREERLREEAAAKAAAKEKEPK